MQKIFVSGHELQVGDILLGWFGQKQILEIVPYDGRLLKSLFPKGARIAYWAPHERKRSAYENRFSLPGMTIPNDETFEIYRNEKGSVAE